MRTSHLSEAHSDIITHSQPGQDSHDEVAARDLKADLELRERKHFQDKRKAGDNDGESDLNVAMRAPSQLVQMKMLAPNGCALRLIPPSAWSIRSSTQVCELLPLDPYAEPMPPDDDDDDSASEKAEAHAKDSDASNDGSDDGSNDEDEDDTEELMRELQKIKRERAEEAARKVPHVQS